MLEIVIHWVFMTGSRTPAVDPYVLYFTIDFMLPLGVVVD